jgi:F-type H+-transporting ATPase subunit gamma
MSGNLIDLRKRIKSVKNTQKITQAMKTVSAVKLRKSNTELHKNTPFMDAAENLLKRVGKQLPLDQFPLLKKRNEGRHVLVVVSSDKGLCGAFNSHLIRFAEAHWVKKCQGELDPKMIIVGNKAFRYFNKKGFPVEKNFSSMMSGLCYERSLEFSEHLQELYMNEDILDIEIAYTQFLSASKQEPGVKQLFPIPLEWEDEVGDEREVEYIFEPEPAHIFRQLLPKYLNSYIYRLLRESEASEHAARMIAMDMATRNASDMIRNLTLTMNKVRQTAITKELLEIITATEALRK